MKGKKWLVLVICLGVVLLASSIGVTRSSFVDLESSTSNTFQAWTSTKWVQTTQTDFEAGVLNNVDTSSRPGDVKLGSVSQAQEPTTSVGSEESFESWYDTSWSRQASVVINNSGSGVTDYQVRVDVTYDADMQADFDDIRFVDSDDSTPLSHWRESYTASTSATFWVKVPSIPVGTKTIYMYYGNATATSASDGDATFVFFETFPNADSAWNGSADTAQDEAGWVTIQDTTTPDTNDVQVSDEDKGNPSPSGGTHLTFEDCDVGWGSPIDQDLAYVPIDLSGYTGITISYYWQSDDVDDGEGMQVHYSTDSTNGVDGTWNLIAEYVNPTDDTWYKETYNLPESACVTNFKLRFSSKSSSYYEHMYVDDMHIRKYASPEPTTSVGSEESWYDTSWSRRAPVTINNPGSGLTDYQVKVDVTYDADMQPDFDDIRFVDSDDSTPLSHWRESYTASTSATFWVKVPSIPSSGKTIYMYYGNATVSSASDGTATFIFFDDFEVDLSKWTEINPGHGTATRVTTPTAPHGSYSVEIDDTSDTEAFGIKATFTSQSICAIEFYMRAAQANENCRVRIKDSAGAIGPFLRFSKFSTIQHKVAGTWTDTTLTYSADTWYEFNLTAVDSADDTYDIWIDGDLKQEHAGFDAVIADISRVAFIGTSVPIPTFYVDLVRVRKYALQRTFFSPGTIASQVLDTGVTGARWDALFWDETLQTNTDITFEARASDTSFAKGDASPSWTPVGGTSPVTSGLPSGRYMQWRATLTTSDTSETPTLHEVRVYHY